VDKPATGTFHTPESNAGLNSFSNAITMDSGCQHGATRMVDIRVSADLENVVRERLKKTAPEIRRSLANIAAGNPLASEPSKIRMVDRLQRKTGFTREEAKLVSVTIDEISKRPEAMAKEAGPEAILGSTLDFVGVYFLERGRRAADAVARVAFLNGAPQGTGFMVAPRLFLTNHHVIQSERKAEGFVAEFDYELDGLRRNRSVSSFYFDPEHCFVTDDIDGLDFTLIGIGEHHSGERRLEDFGYLPLSDASDKHMLGEIANVIQHPDGRFKEVVLRENHLVARDDTVQVLHYVADTEQGSSGSPVFNNEWEPIALHHWAGPWREVMGTSGSPLSREINEGIRISAIVRHLAEGTSRSNPAVTTALDLWNESARAAPPALTPRDLAEDAGRANAPRTEETGKMSKSADGPVPRSNPDGSVTWTLPIEISVRLPGFGSPAAQSEPKSPKTPAVALRPEAAPWKTEAFDDRGGYEPGFVPGFVVPFPGTDGVGWRVAKNQLAATGDDENELRYHHFSIVMNADRRLCGCTAVNIDGGRLKAVNRDTKTVTDNPSLSELGIESIGQEGAEASDDFRPDRRILPAEQMTKEFYDKQKVPGFAVANAPARIARMFQKGHIILRGDPAWGGDEEALLAERDTFFYTNAAPQLGFFNQGSELTRPGSKGKLRWRAVETYMLRNARTMRKRISVFAGPIFAEGDPEYRFGSRVPMRFWRIAVWNDGDELRSIALLADQKPLIEAMPEAMTGAEAFGDEEELARVSEFLSTVEEIEDHTKLDFGVAVREADIRGGGEALRTPAAEFKPADLTTKPQRSSNPRPRANTRSSSTSPRRKPK
jgi:endonuclease G